MYIEEIVAEYLRDAAKAGKIPELDAAEIYTDLNGSNEWKGRPKLYAIRDSIEPIADLGGEYGYSGLALMKLALVALGADKTGALGISRAAMRTFKRIGKIPGTLDIFQEDPADEIELEDGDEICIYREEAGTDTAELAAEDELTVDAEDEIFLGDFTAEGTVTGDGWIIPTDGTGAPNAGWNIWRAVFEDMTDWRLNTIAATERFENGAWREQYYQTRGLEIIARVAAE